MSTEYPQPQKGYHTDVPFQSFSESVQSDSDSQWYPQKTASVPLALPVSIPNDPLPSGSFSFATAEVEQASIAHRPPPLPPTVDPPVNQTKYPPSLSLSSSPYQITGPTAPPLYSTAGFDMMSILVRVTSRSDPQIVLGPVDFSCSFVLVDVRRYDHPILYASPAFLKLTGYEANEVVGRNCRFLQAPDGNVSRGSQRAYTDPHAVGHIHKSLLRNNECQVNLMNYRKGGQPFLNLISIVPIPWDADSDEIRYLVGFQVDLVNQPNAILQTMKDGTYRVNYSNMMNGGPAAGLGAPEQGLKSPVSLGGIGNADAPRSNRHLPPQVGNSPYPKVEQAVPEKTPSHPSNASLAFSSNEAGLASHSHLNQGSSTMDNSNRKSTMRAPRPPADFDLSEYVTVWDQTNRGGYSDVYKGALVESTARREVAIKALRLQGSLVSVLTDERLHKRFYREVLLWKTLQHPNIVPFLGYMIFDADSPALISPWYLNGNVIEYLKYQPNADRNSLAFDVIRGLEYLHSIAIAHGDLKGENVLVDSIGRASLCDFGMSQFIEDTARITGFTTTNQHLGGTDRFMCPELFEGEPKLKLPIFGRLDV